MKTAASRKNSPIKINGYLHFLKEHTRNMYSVFLYAQQADAAMNAILLMLRNAPLSV